MRRPLDIKLLGLWLGPIFSIALFFLPRAEGLSQPALAVAAVATLMAVWWITEAIPLAATALLPILLFPIFEVTSVTETTRAYGHHLIYLFLGGFLIAVTIERWRLHQRIALITILLVGAGPRRMVFGFMLATAFLSMWVSNTATTMMMLPIGLSVIAQLQHLQLSQQTPKQAQEYLSSGPNKDNFATPLLLGIAYGASIGGVATLVGTPPNAILAGMAEQLLGLRIGFADWLLIGLPLSTVMLLLSWLYLTRIAYRCDDRQIQGASDSVKTALDKLGPLSSNERSVAIVFAMVACAWIIRGMLDLPWLANINDSSIAISGALLLFVLPASGGGRLLDWATAIKIPWEILILFGGGFALAQGFDNSGLSHWVVTQTGDLQGATGLLIIFALTGLVILMTEITSNTATAALVIPLMVPLAESTGLHPYALMVPAALAASYAFMLPVATPPNAIVFGSRMISIRQMARTGLWLNLIATLLITAMVFWLLPWVWGFSLTTPN